MDQGYFKMKIGVRTGAKSPSHPDPSKLPKGVLKVVPCGIYDCESLRGRG